MYHYFLFIFSIFTFLGCSSDNAISDATNSIDDIYTPSASLLECATSKQNISVTSQTDIPMLVVLINYNNVQITSPFSTWAQKIFSKNSGTLNDYYTEISQNQFEFSEATECNGIASVLLGKNHPDTDINSPLFNTNVYPDLASALSILDDKVSFNAYDTNGDGYIQANELLITFIIAGYEDAYEGSHVTNGIWAHQDCVDSINAPLLDGVRIMGCTNNGNYALFGERHDARFNTHDATIGIIAHELGHSAFNLPDLYLGGGVGSFALMGGGTWAYASQSEFPGQTPVHMNAWSKYKNGWVIPDDANGTKVINATSSSSYNIVKVQKNTTQFYLLENRANSGYDRGLYMLDGTFDGGVAIWQIDTTKTTQDKIDNNSVNSDAANQGVYMLNAQGGFIDGGSRGNENALFYTGNVASYFNGDANITNISTRGNPMTLDVN